MNRRMGLAVMAVIGISALGVSHSAAADAIEKELATWFRDHQEAIADLTAWPDLQVKPGAAFKATEAVVIYLPAWPEDGRLVIPRLNNPLGKAYLLGRPEQELVVKPEPHEWLLSLPTELPHATRPVVIVKTVGAPQWAKAPVSIGPNDEGVFILAAHDAVTHGELIRYEPQPHKNTVGYWANPKDWFGWSLKVPAAGNYTVRVLQGCGKGQGGSAVSLRAVAAREQQAVKHGPAVEPIRFTVEDTGHFQNFIPRAVGTLSFPEPGDYAIEVRCDKLAAHAVMDVREVRLIPLSP